MVIYADIIIAVIRKTPFARRMRKSPTEPSRAASGQKAV
jgi:hypothetical protein